MHITDDSKGQDTLIDVGTQNLWLVLCIIPHTITSHCVINHADHLTKIEINNRLGLTNTPAKAEGTNTYLLTIMLFYSSYSE